MSLPTLSIVVVPVPPKYAVYADSCVEDALVNLFRPDQKFESERRVEEAEEPEPDRQVPAIA